MRKLKRAGEIRVRIGKQDQARIDRLCEKYETTTSALIRSLIWRADQEQHLQESEKERGIKKTRR